MEYSFSKEIYLKEALIKAAYSFTDQAYIHIDTNEDCFIVNIEAKDPEAVITEKEFQNAILAETVRLFINDRTKNIRELIMARAFSSTIIEEDKPEAPDELDVNIDEILTDWFDENE